MTRPFILANGGSPGVKASVSASSSVTLTLDSVVGVRSVQWVVLSTDELSSVGDYTLTPSGSLGQTCTFTSLGEGTAVLIKVIVNSGLVRGVPNLDETSNTVKVFVPTSDGLEVGAAGERYESDSTFATTGILNAPIRVLNTFTISLYENDFKRAIASSTTNVALTGDPSPVDNVTVATGDVVLLLGQTSSAENGLWKVSTTGVWTRPANFASTAAVQGSLISVTKGTDRGGFLYQNTNQDDPVINTDSLTFNRIPDRYDRADIALASETPGSDNLTRFGFTGGLTANFFKYNTANVSSTGLLRSPHNFVLAASRNSGNSADVKFLASNAHSPNDVTLGDTVNASFINLDVPSTGTITLNTEYGSFLEAYYDQPNNASILKTTGVLELRGTTVRTKATTSARWHNGTNDFLILAYDGSSVVSFISLDDRLDLRGQVETDVRPNVALCGTPGDFGGGSLVVWLHDAAVVPTVPPTTGIILYCDAGTLKALGSLGTVTPIAVP